MKSSLILAMSLALAVSTSAFAQDSSPMPAPQAAVDQPAASGPDAQQPNAPHRHAHHRQSTQYNSANEALTGNEPKDVAYWSSNQEKTYPAVDHGHVPGDPPVINHNDDQAPVNDPTTTKITIPPQR